MKSTEPTLFKTANAFERWLAKHHADASEVWVQLFKKSAGVDAMSYDEAVDVALCYGWIDSVMRSYDERSYIQRFSPRKSKSPWTKTNLEKAKRLIAEGRMKPSGLEAYHQANGKE